MSGLGTGLSTGTGTTDAPMCQSACCMLAVPRSLWTTASGATSRGAAFCGLLQPPSMTVLDEYIAFHSCVYISTGFGRATRSASLDGLLSTKVCLAILTLASSSLVLGVSAISNPYRDEMKQTPLPLIVKQK